MSYGNKVFQDLRISVLQPRDFLALKLHQKLFIHLFLNKANMLEELTKEEFMDKRKSDDFVLVNVLSRDTYEKGHILGSINIPADEIEKEAAERFTDTQDIVVYCLSEDCHASEKAADKLEEMGFEHVSDFIRGLEG
jgi:rhodanese-related sulfurtransferase